MCKTAVFVGIGGGSTGTSADGSAEGTTAALASGAGALTADASLAASGALTSDVEEEDGALASDAGGSEAPHATRPESESAHDANSRAARLPTAARALY
jgi:hypothetical protein